MTVIDSPASPLLIRAPALRRALVAGVRQVIARRDWLNKINVFPVPDGDTGSNLASTLGSVLSGALSRRSRHAGDLLVRVGEQAVDGARGNSGAILAQFFTGVAEAVGPLPSLTPAVLAQAVRAGAGSARQALSQPREGTIVSVISAFAEALDTSERVADVRSWFDQALARARQALAHTPAQLPVLAKAGVVDAGGQGFVDLLEGIAGFIAAGRSVRAAGEGRSEEADEFGAADLEVADLESAMAHGELAEGDPEHRYCTECLVLGDGLDRTGLAAVITALGASCVVIAGSHRRIRVHAHVADPGQLFAAAGHFGRVDACKADDMHAQARSAAASGLVAIITDSAADLPDTVAASLNIHVVPVRVGFGEHDYLDKVGLSTAEFYRRLRTERVLPRTSQPPPGDFRRQFEFLLSHHPALVYVGLSGAVSGTLQSAQTAAQRGHPDRTVVFDSINAAGGQGLLAIAAAEAAQCGAGVAEIVAELERLRPLTLTWAMARDVSHAVRGGRLPAWARPVVEALGVTPIARVSTLGRLSMAGALFGSRRAPERFAAYVAKRVDARNRWRILIGHCDAADDARRLSEALQARLDCQEAWVVETGPAVGAHAGPGALVVSVQPVRSSRSDSATLSTR